MNPLLAFAIYYGVALKTIIPCGNNVHGSPNVKFTCAEVQSQSHFVEFLDEDKALRFVHNLKPYNRSNSNDPRIEDGKRFIYDMTVYTYTKIDGKWTQINKHEVD
jgi:hypothetical protein